MQQQETEGSLRRGPGGKSNPATTPSVHRVSTTTVRPNIFAPMVGAGIGGPYLQREALLPRFTPQRLPHRGAQVSSLAEALRTTLGGQAGATQLLVGANGSGKSATAAHVLAQLEEAAALCGQPLQCVRLTCARYEGAYQILLALDRALPGGPPVPSHGWPLERLYDALGAKLEALGGPVVLCLDELDSLSPPAIEEVLLLLTERSSDLTGPGLTLLLILNNGTLVEDLPPKVAGRLGAHLSVFPPYDAEQLADILAERADVALRPDALGSGVLALCAALAAQEHGDARRALELLRTAADEAATGGCCVIDETHVRRAISRGEGDVLTAVALGLPLPARLLLLASADAARARGDPRVRRPSSRDVLRHFAQRCAAAGVGFGGAAATAVRGSQLLAELGSLGLLEVPLAAPGRTRRGIAPLLHDAQLEVLVAADARLGPLQQTRSVQRRL